MAKTYLTEEHAASDLSNAEIASKVTDLLLLGWFHLLYLVENRFPLHQFVGVDSTERCAT